LTGTAACTAMMERLGFDATQIGQSVAIERTHVRLMAVGIENRPETNIFSSVFHKEFDLLSRPRANAANDAARAVRIADQHNARIHPSQEPPAQFAVWAVAAIKKNQGLRIRERPLRFGEIHAVIRHVDALLGRVPLKLRENMAAGFDYQYSYSSRI
jgi:hypothetical protein